jgi:NAD+ synthase
MPGRLVVTLPPRTEETLVRFLRAQVAQASAEGVVVGLSGGVDSALVARLACEALGPERVRALSLPDENTPPELRSEVGRYARTLGVSLREVSIGPWFAALRQDLPELSDRTGGGNARARLRMIALYACAGAHRDLVLGTGNKSEILLGYFTKFGDGGTDLLPLGDLYKTAVYALARTLELPPSILDRPPSAGLYPGQTDEQELGEPYTILDPILLGLEELWEPEAIARELDLSLPRVLAVARRVDAARHKRRLPPIPKLGLRTVGLDWRD